MSKAAPTVDVGWIIDEDVPPGPYPRDTQFVFRRVPELVAGAATTGRPHRLLEVACGLGGQLALLRRGVHEAWGLDASLAIMQHCRKRFADQGGAPLVCAAAETLPFRGGSFDRVVCQGSLDHFARPRSFLREVARVLAPDGRAIIGISNYDSLSCRLGRGLFRLREGSALPVYRGRNYWQIPPNHTFRGTKAVLQRLGQPYLDLVECRGISLLWLFHRWTQLMEALPRPLTWSTMTVLDSFAYRVPALADIIVSVWRPRREDE
jgi:SAM-dependent methyltransferase